MNPTGIVAWYPWNALLSVACLSLFLSASLSLSLSLSLERGLVPLRESLGSVRRACNLSYSLAVDTDGIKHGVCIQCPTKVLVSLGLRENFREGFFLEERKEGRKEEIGSVSPLSWSSQLTRMESNTTCVLYSVRQKFSDLFICIRREIFLFLEDLENLWLA